MDVLVDRIEAFLGTTAVVRIEVSDGWIPPLSDKNSAAIPALPREIHKSFSVALADSQGESGEFIGNCFLLYRPQYYPRLGETCQ